MATLSIKQKPLKINYNLFKKTLNSLYPQITYFKIGCNLYLTNGIIAIDMPYNEKELETFIKKTGAVESDTCSKIIAKYFSELNVKTIRTNIIKRTKEGKLIEYFKLENNEVVLVDVDNLKILDKLHVYEIYGRNKFEPLVFNCGEIKVLILPLILPFRHLDSDKDIIEFIKENY